MGYICTPGFPLRDLVEQLRGFEQITERMFAFRVIFGTCCSFSLFKHWSIRKKSSFRSGVTSFGKIYYSFKFRLLKDNFRTA